MAQNLSYDHINLTMLTDFYEITMANGYFTNGFKDTIGYFDMFFRKVPDGGGFAIMAGVEQLVNYLSELSFTQEDIDYLRSKHIFREEFLDYLKNFKFTCDVWAVPEGTPIFPGEPIVTVRGPVIQAQFVETMVLLSINHQSLIATKTNRIVRAADGSFVAGSWAKGGVCVVPLPGFRAWTPDDPYLYTLDITCGEDRVESYFAMRKFSYVELGGHKVFGLNNAPLFHNGLLDQGYYPDGLLTPPSDEAMVNDIETMKRCGFNMLRKHIKIEPLRWYYHCDRLGMIVWQDMVSGGQPYSFLHVSALPTLGKVDLPDQDAKPYGRSGVLSRARFRREMADTVRLLYNCPCIALWTVFNEGWGQFDALDMANELKKLDPTRFIDHASGWQDQGYEEMKSRHIYFRPVKLKNDGRALALTEYGGYILAVDGHRWTDKVFGYRICRNSAALAHDYEKLMLGQILPHIRKEGLTAAVYTQITDVEEELNGLMTYDREVLKIPEETLREINAALRFDI